MLSLVSVKGNFINTKRIHNLVKGDKFHCLTFLSYSEGLKDGRRYGLFLCDCGKTAEARIQGVVRGNNRSCGCLIKGAHWRKINKKYGDDYCFVILIKKIKAHAKKRNIYFGLTYLDIKEKFIEQNGLCYYTKEKLNLPNKTHDRHDDGFCSVDRTDPKKGYTKDNIRLVTKFVNYMKHVLSEDYFLQTCNKISKNHPRNTED